MQVSVNKTKVQCRGITRKGTRCRIYGPTPYCRHHNSTSPDAQPRPKPQEKSLAGYIYIYTLCQPGEAFWYDHTKQKYRAMHRGSILSALHRLLGRDKVLVKVGYTTYTPLKRMAQWEMQCHHKLEPVVPKRRAAPHYDHDRLGWQSASAHRDEQAIHSILRQKFGTGKVQCQGCDGSGVHVEWFLLPCKSRLKDVFATIESVLLSV